jgi:hypothetical protein
MAFPRSALVWPVVLAVRVGAQETTAPTPLEQALIEHVCNASRVVGAVESGAYQTCLHLKLASLRADFGRDLSKLSVADRKTIDSACSKVLETRDRDAYVECLSTQLTALSSQRSRATPGPATAPSPAPASPASPQSLPPEPSSESPVLRIGLGLAIVLLGAGGAFTIMRRRRVPTAPAAPSTCRMCGAAAAQPGGMCERCRREAADAARRASAERADQTQKNLQELRQQKARQDEEARQREQQRARQQEQETRQREEETTRREAEARRREEEARRASQTTGDSARDELDPHAILGVSRDATTEQIRAAYDEAMSKYDLTNVEHLSPELQEHYKTKAQAVERAFLMLTR